MNRSRYLTRIAVVLTAACWIAQVSAQEEQRATEGEHAVVDHTHTADESTSQVLACATLRKDSERLACYDRLAAWLSSGKNAASPASPPSPQELFGLGGRASDAESPKAPLERKSLDSITAKVTSVRLSAQGGAVVELDNGQTWQQQGSEDLLLRNGDAVKVSRAALGSFWMTTPSGRGARVKRVR